MNKQKTIAIIGGTIWGNRGAESMLTTTIGKLREKYPHAKFNVYSYYPKHDAALIADSSIEILDSSPKALALIHFPFALLYGLIKLFGISIPLPSLLKKLKSSDILLDIGGITFADGRAVFLLFNVLTIWPAMLLGVPVVKLAQAVGPFNTLLNRLVSRIFLGHCERIFARGNITQEYLADLNLSVKNWEESSDIAFLYSSKYSLSNENENKVGELLQKLQEHKDENKKVIAICPSSLVYSKSKEEGKGYIDNYLNLFRRFKIGDTKFVFLPNATRYGSTSSRNNDLLVIERVFQEFKSTLSPQEFNQIVWVDFDLNSAGIRRITAKADILITSRFHSMISGLSTGVPTLVIGWSHKYLEVLSSFGLDKYALDYKNEKDLNKLVDELLTSRAEISKQIFEKLKDVESLSARQFKYLEKFIG